jgi:surface protein
MKKLISLSLFGLLFSLNLSANQELALGKLKKIPLNLDLLSFENGGNKSAIDAYSDGVGLYTVGLEDQKFSAMNELVFKYGEEAKKSGETLKEHVLDKGNNKEQELASLLGTTVSGTVIGAPCDDGVATTENDRYIDTNGTCQGTEIVVRNSVKCEEEAIGSSIIVDGISYLVVDNDSIKNNLDRAETLCTSNVTDMSALFAYNTTFNDNISKWDTSNVVVMNSMFFNSINFNQDISSWDTSKVDEMSYMFAYAESFNQNINNWDVSNVQSFYDIVYNATNFNQSLDNFSIEACDYYTEDEIFEIIFEGTKVTNKSYSPKINFNYCPPPSYT